MVSQLTKIWAIIVLPLWDARPRLTEANQALDRMTRSAVSRVFQRGRPWRSPRHRSARSA